MTDHATPNLPSRDFEATSQFYTRLGFQQGWRGWLTLKQQELALGNGAQREPEATGNAGARIEIADLKERIRKLEAIAAGVDL